MRTFTIKCGCTQQQFVGACTQDACAWALEQFGDWPYVVICHR